MKRTTLIAGLSILLLSGCKSDDAASTYQPYVSLAQFDDSAETNYYHGNGTVHLGAGDSLGREIFVNYLAHMHSVEDQQEFFATVPDNAERLDK